MNAPQPFGLSSSSRAVLAALLEARTGQQIADHRSWRLDTALQPLLRERGLGSLDELVALLMAGTDALIADRIVEALLNGESSFFRDQSLFDLIEQAMGEAARPGGLRIWSAGCATGQEPLSLAMMFAERAEAGGGPVPEIVATDVSQASLRRARAGRYNQFEIQRGLPIRRMMRWFQGDGDWIADPALVAMVSYRRMNLVSDPPPAGRYDLILCRNVLLYLTGEAKQSVFSTLASALRPGGFLALGAGETVIGQTELFRPSARYRGLYERGDDVARRAA